MEMTKMEVELQNEQIIKAVKKIEKKERVHNKNN
jgi:hypothetical protein